MLGREKNPTVGWGKTPTEEVPICGMLVYKLGGVSHWWPTGNVGWAGGVER